MSGVAEERCDVVVVGAGAAGVAAACSARRAGARVGLFDGGTGASVLSGGCWDVPRGPFSEGHPMRRLSGANEALVEAFSELAEGPLALRLGGEDTALVAATEAGRLREAAALDPELLDLGSLPPGCTVAVVRSPGVREITSRFLPGALTEESRSAAQRWRFVPLEFDWKGCERAVEAAAVLREHGEAERLGRSLGEAASAAGADALLLPPVLGTEASRDVVEAVREAAGVPLGEWHAPLDPVQGMRRRARWLEVLRRAGVVRWAERLEEVGRSQEGFVLRSAEGSVVRCSALVLATGRHLTALRWDGGLPREGLLGLPLGDGERALAVPGHPEGPDPMEVFGAEWPCRGEAWRWGVRVDVRARPLGEGGRAFDERLFAAGDLLGGHDPAGVPGGLGTALASGWLAGRGAAEAVAGI